VQQVDVRREHDAIAARGELQAEVDGAEIIREVTLV